MRRVLTLVAAAVALATAGCVGGAAVATDRCDPVRVDILRKLGEGFDEPGTIRNGFAVQSIDAGQAWFISAEFLPASRGGLERAGDIYTWVAESVDHPVDSYRVVDPRGRENWADSEADIAEVDVRADGAIESRACVNQVRPSAGNTGLLSGGGG